MLKQFKQNKNNFILLRAIEAMIYKQTNIVFIFCVFYMCYQNVFANILIKRLNVQVIVVRSTRSISLFP